MLLGLYPTLSLSLIHKVIAFCLDHPQQVEHYLSQEQSRAQQQRAGGTPLPGVEELRRRLSSRAIAG
jgi:hypothetical protein